MQRRRDIRKEAGRLKAGQINRRRFVMSALASGVTLPTAMSLASKAEAQVPQRGGHLRVAMQSGADFDALLALATANTLTEIAGDGTLVGDLAQGFASDDGGRTWVFDLRSGVTFADGTELTSSHIVDNLLARRERHLPTVAEVRALHRDQVAITLGAADMTFPRRLADPRLTITRTGTDGSVYGSGGYVIQHIGQDIIHLRRRAEYWKSGRAHIESVTLTKTPSVAALQAEVMAGKVDYAPGIAPETTAFLSHLPDLDIVQFPATKALVLHTAPGTNRGISQDAIRILRAGIDRQSFIDRALLGHGRPGDDTPLPPMASTRHLPEVIAPNTLSSEPVIVDHPDGTNWLPHLTACAAEIGIPLETDLTQPSRSTLRATTLSADVIDAWLTDGFATEGAFGIEGKAAGDIRARFSAARSISDETLRVEEYAQACHAIAACDALFIPAWANELAARSRKLVHPEHLTPNQPNDGHRLIERWWLA